MGSVASKPQQNHQRTLFPNPDGGSRVNATRNQGNIANIWPADVNGDGKADLVLANFRDGTLTVLKNTSSFPPAMVSPTLNIKAQGNAVQVAWPSASPGWSLQQKPDLTTTSWLPSGYGGYVITDNGTIKSLTLPLPKGSQFFRLIHP